MADSIGTFAGIGSGFSYRALVDQIIALDSRPTIAMQSAIDRANAQLKAYGSYSTLLTALESAAKTLRDGTAFQPVSTTVSNATTATNLTVLQAAAKAGAAPGSYAVQVLQLAQAEKISGSGVSSTSTALGYSGDFVLNGHVVTVVASDTLGSIRDKINAVNTGTNPSGVIASIVADSATSQRLVLTAQNSGAAGIDLVDGAQGVAQQLGWIDSTQSIKHATSSGAQSDNFASASTSIASQLGLATMPGPYTVTVAGQAVSIDLGTDSLNSIATKLSALTGIQASVQTTTVNGATKYYLDVRNTTSFVDAGNTLEQLGIMKAGRSAIAQQLQGGVLTAGNATTPATASTLITSIWNGGAASGAAAGDTLTISGTRGDGAAVNLTFTVTSTSTVQDLLNALNATTAFGGGTRPATATIDSAGHIVLTDGTAGQSQLAMQVVANNQGGGRLDLGAFTATSVGRARQLAAGADARFTVDGVAFTRTSNTVTDAIADTTLTLTGADPNVTAQVVIARSAQMAQQSVQAYVDAYNKVIDFIQAQQKPGTDPTSNPILYNDGLLRTARSGLSTKMLSTILGAAPDLATAGMAGLSLTKDGHLSLDATKFTTAFDTRFTDLQTLFMERGTATNAAVAYGASTSATLPGTYAVDITAAATQAAVTGTGFSGTYADDATADTITVTDLASNNAVSVQLSNGMTAQQIVDALNTAFKTPVARSLQTSAVLMDSTGTTAATTSTLMTDLKNSSGVSMGVVAGDTIDYSGLRADGTAYSGSFTVTATSTVADFVGQIQNALGTGATVSFAGGQMTVTATATGTSTMSLSLTPNNQGGGTLSFGTVNTLAAGHGILDMTATNVAGQIKLNDNSYGTAAGFSVAYTPGGTDSTAQLGLAAGSYYGTNVAGTIGGYAATGSGRTLTGATGTPVDGLSISYTGTTTGAMGNITLSQGVGSLVDQLVKSWTDPTGSVQNRENQLNTTIASQQRRIDDFNARMDIRKQALLKQYLAMDVAVQRIQAQGNAFLAAVGAGSVMSAYSAIPGYVR